MNRLILLNYMLIQSYDFLSACQEILNYVGIEKKWLH